MFRKRDAYQESFFAYIAETDEFPSRVLSKIRAGIKDKTIVFYDKDVDPYSSIVYYGPKRSIYITPSVYKDFIGGDLNRYIVVGIVARSVYKYLDIYGFGAITNVFGEMIEDFYSSLFKMFLSIKQTLPSYTLEEISSVASNKFLDLASDPQMFFVKTCHHSALKLSVLYDDLREYLVTYLNDNMSVGPEVMLYIEKNLKRLFNERYLYYDFKDCVDVDKLITRSKAFESFSIKYKRYPHYVYLPCRVFKYPIEPFVKVMEYTLLELSIRPSKEYVDFVDFFTKVI